MLEWKKGVIFGIANDHSIAWGIGKKLRENGAKLAITYQNSSLLKRVKPLSEKLNSEFLIECDVSKEKNISNCFEKIAKKWTDIDFVIHAVVRRYEEPSFPGHLGGVL